MVDTFLIGLNKDDNNGGLTAKIWNDIKSKKDFVDNKQLNDYIISYVNNNNIENYKNDIISLIGPKVKEINMDGKDPQEIFVIPFMCQQNLI